MSKELKSMKIFPLQKEASKGSLKRQLSDEGDKNVPSPNKKMRQSLICNSTLFNDILL